MDVLEAMATCRAMRFLKRDPVPEELVRELIFAATRASNPGNSQAWHFVVLTDPARKARIAEAVRKVMGPALPPSSSCAGATATRRSLPTFSSSGRRSTPPHRT